MVGNKVAMRIFIFFVYGLAYFTLGLSVLLESRRHAIPQLTPALTSLAAFGFFHSLHEWAEMTESIAELSRINPFTSRLAGGTHVGALAVSLLFLMSYGLRLMGIGKSVVRGIVAFFIVLWLAVSYLIWDPGHFGLNLDRTELLTRYPFSFPANLAAAAGTLYISKIRKPETEIVKSDIRIAAVLFLILAVISGLIGPKQAFFPADAA